MTNIITKSLSSALALSTLMAGAQTQQTVEIRHVDLPTISPVDGGYRCPPGARLVIEKQDIPAFCVTYEYLPVPKPKEPDSRYRPAIFIHSLLNGPPIAQDAPA